MSGGDYCNNEGILYTAAAAEGANGRRDKLQALFLAKECYAMKLDLLSSATVVQRAMNFVDRNRGFMPQKQEARIDQHIDTTESIQDIR